MLEFLFLLQHGSCLSFRKRGMKLQLDGQANDQVSPDCNVNRSQRHAFAELCRIEEVSHQVRTTPTQAIHSDLHITVRMVVVEHKPEVSCLGLALELAIQSVEADIRLL